MFKFLISFRSLIWNDSFVSLEKISALGNHQRINHFVGMGEICHRSSLVKNVARQVDSFCLQFPAKLLTVKLLMLIMQIDR